MIFCLLSAFSAPAWAGRSDDLGAKWTIMVYMNAKNNLECAALDNFADMATVGSNANVNLVAELGRPKQTYGCADDNPWSGVLRFHIKRGQRPVPENAIGNDAVPSSRDLDMGSAETLSDFVNWSMSKYPAKHYVLIIWNHGQGWRFQTALKRDDKLNAARGRALSKDFHSLAGTLGKMQSSVGGYRSVSFDEDSGNFLYNSDIEISLKKLLKAQKLDVLGFDACLMAMLETAYAMRDVASVLVGSEELEPEAGWNYGDWLRKLNRNPAATDGKSLGKILIQSYQREYRDRLRTTLSAVALDGAEAIADRLSELSDIMKQNLNTELQTIRNARAGCQNYGKAAKVPMHNPVDLSCFLSNVSVVSSNDTLVRKASEVQHAIDSAIVANYASSRIQEGYGSHGISIYFPSSKANYESDVPDNAGYVKGNQDHQVDFVEHQRWADFLSVYLARN